MDGVRGSGFGRATDGVSGIESICVSHTMSVTEIPVDAGLSLKITDKGCVQ